MRKMRTWREVLIEWFGNCREEALGYLQASMACAAETEVPLHRPLAIASVGNRAA